MRHLRGLHPSPPFLWSLKNKREQQGQTGSSGWGGGGGGTRIHLHRWIDVITRLAWVVGWRTGDGRRGTEGEIRGGQIMTSSTAELEESRWGLSPRLLRSSNYWGRKSPFSSSCSTSGLLWMETSEPLAAATAASPGRVRDESRGGGKVKQAQVKETRKIEARKCKVKLTGSVNTKTRFESLFFFFLVLLMDGGLRFGEKDRKSSK